MRLSAEQRRAFLQRLDPERAHLSLLHGTGGRLVVGAEGPWRWAELQRGGVFIVGYQWRRGALAESVVLTLPSTQRVAFVPAQAPPLIGSIPPPRRGAAA